MYIGVSNILKKKKDKMKIRLRGRKMQGSKKATIIHAAKCYATKESYQKMQGN